MEFADVVERPFRHHGGKARIHGKHIVAECRQGTLHPFELLKCLSKFCIIFDHAATSVNPCAGWFLRAPGQKKPRIRHKPQTHASLPASQNRRSCAPAAWTRHYTQTAEAPP